MMLRHHVALSKAERLAASYRWVSVRARWFRFLTVKINLPLHCDLRGHYSIGFGLVARSYCVVNSCVVV